MAIGDRTVGHVFLHNDVKVGAAEAEGANARDPRLAGGDIPVAQLGVDGKGRHAPVHDGVGALEVDAGRQHFVVQREGRLEQACRARGRLEVAEVRLHGAERDRPNRHVRSAERLHQGAQLDRVAHASGRAVALDQRAVRGGDPGVLPRAFDGEALADRVGGRDALALAVARAADAPHHGVDPIVVANRVSEPLDHEQRGALAHHESVRAVGVRPRAGGRQGADRAELHERVCAHVAIHSAGDRNIEIVREQPFDGCVHRRQRRGAGRIGGEARTVEVEQVGDPAGDAVAELAGHGVLGHHRKPVLEPLAQLALHRRADLGRKRAEGLGSLELAGELREHDAQAGQVVLLAPEGAADDHRGPIEIERTLGPAGVRRAPCACTRPPTFGRRPSSRPPSAGSGASSQADSTPSHAPNRRSSSTSSRSRADRDRSRAQDPSAPDRRR